MRQIFSFLFFFLLLCTVPVITINTVAGYTAKMECDLQSSRPDDSAYLVLWYIESEKQPIYRLENDSVSTMNSEIVERMNADNVVPFG
jgi:hypothetical protein